jgi:hypothetical protein
LIIKRLAEVAEKLPYESIECLEVILLDQSKSRLYVSTLSEVGTILQVALSNPDQRTKDIAIRIINLFAEQGDLRFRALVDDVVLH